VRINGAYGGKDYDATWHRRMRGQGPYAEMVAQRFDVATRRLGLARNAPPMRCDLFRPPAIDGPQMSLF
jgi:hypothetical protein